MVRNLEVFDLGVRMSVSVQRIVTLNAIAIQAGRK